MIGGGAGTCFGGDVAGRRVWQGVGVSPDEERLAAEKNHCRFSEGAFGCQLDIQSKGA